MKEIKESYNKYQDLLKDTKNTSTPLIILDEIKGNHPNTRTKEVDVLPVTIPEKMKLVVESKIGNKRDFKFKLMAPEYIDKPFFRFDSAGQPHYNRLPGVELPKQKVYTPHFHKFDAEGRNIAYKTEALNKESEREALLNDITLCMAHYSDESQTYFQSKNYLEVVQTPPTELDFDSNNDNPTEGVDYV